MFEPGHLHIQRAALQPNDCGYDLNIDYEVVSAPRTGLAIHFTLHGEINCKAFTEAFELPKDMAFNFASDAYRLAVKHGLPKGTNIISMHDEYDAMFEDIRDKLNAKSGDPMKPEHLG